MTTSNEYGTVEFYESVFSDILADVGTGIKDRDEETAIAMLQGFERAIMSWMSYHEESITSYRNLHARFLGINRDD